MRQHVDRYSAERSKDKDPIEIWETASWQVCMKRGVEGAGTRGRMRIVALESY